MYKPNIESSPGLYACQYDQNYTLYRMTHPYEINEKEYSFIYSDCMFIFFSRY